MKKVIIVCDGSSLGNGTGKSRAAACAVLGYKGHWQAFAKYLGEATNQQSEIAAAELGLSQLSEPCKTRILSDSRYVVQTMLGNFRQKSNKNWWAKLEKAASKHHTEWEWVKGHAGNEIQEIADKIARKTAKIGYVDREFIKDAVLDIGVRFQM